MPRRHWTMRVRDMLEAASKIISHTDGLDFAAFSSDDWTVDATLRNFAVIGEAARHIPDEVASAYPDVPWADIRDMRNILIHEYFGVDLSIVWNAIREDLPALIPQLEAMLARNHTGSP